MLEVVGVASNIKWCQNNLSLKVWKGNSNIVAITDNQEFPGMAVIIIYNNKAKVIHLSYPLP